MRRLLPLLIGVTMTLLAGCADKREICTKFNATGAVGATKTKYLEKTYKDLGISYLYEKERGFRSNYAGIDAYCEFYKE